MARYRKATPIQDNLPLILRIGAVLLLVLFLFWAYPRVAPAVKDLLAPEEDKTEAAAPGTEAAPDSEAIAPETEEAPQETAPDSEAAAPETEEGPDSEDGGAEARSLKERLWAAGKKFWPVLPAAAVAVEVLDHLEKGYELVKRFLRFLSGGR